MTALSRLVSKLFLQPGHIEEIFAIFLELNQARVSTVLFLFAIFESLPYKIRIHVFTAFLSNLWLGFLPNGRLIAIISFVEFGAQNSEQGILVVDDGAVRAGD